MKSLFVYALQFSAWRRQHGLTDEDLRGLELAILRNPEIGAVIAGTGGVRKMRLARAGAGKSGGFRVCYAWFPEFAVVLVAMGFAKNEASNLSARQKADCRAMVAAAVAALVRTRRRR